MTVWLWLGWTFAAPPDVRPFKLMPRDVSCAFEVDGARIFLADAGDRGAGPHGNIAIGDRGLRFPFRSPESTLRQGGRFEGSGVTVEIVRDDGSKLPSDDPRYTRWGTASMTVTQEGVGEGTWQGQWVCRSPVSVLGHPDAYGPCDARATMLRLEDGQIQGVCPRFGDGELELTWLRRREGAWETTAFTVVRGFRPMVAGQSARGLRVRVVDGTTTHVVSGPETTVSEKGGRLADVLGNSRVETDWWQRWNRRPSDGPPVVRVDGRERTLPAGSQVQLDGHGVVALGGGELMVWDRGKEPVVAEVPKDLHRILRRDDGSLVGTGSTPTSFLVFDPLGSAPRTWLARTETYQEVFHQPDGTAVVRVEDGEAKRLQLVDRKGEPVGAPVELSSKAWVQNAVATPTELCVELRDQPLLQFEWVCRPIETP